MKLNTGSFYSGQSHLFSSKYRLAQEYTPDYLQCPNLLKKLQSQFQLAVI